MRLHFLAALAAAMLVPACATPPPDWETDALDREKYPRVVQFSEHDVDSPPQAVAECARDRLLEIGEEGSSGQAYSTVPFIEQLNGNLTLIGRTPFGQPYGVTFQDTGDATHAVIYVSIEYQYRRRIGETIGNILRACS